MFFHEEINTTRPYLFRHLEKINHGDACSIDVLCLSLDSMSYERR